MDPRSEAGPTGSTHEPALGLSGTARGVQRPTNSLRACARTPLPVAAGPPDVMPAPPAKSFWARPRGYPLG